jgi:hypothetical protein
MIGIRPEEPGDIAGIHDVNHRAFGQDQEGNIVDALRANGGALLSLVASSKVGSWSHHVQSSASWQRAWRSPRSDVGCTRRTAARYRNQAGGSGKRAVGSGRLPFVVVVWPCEFYPRFGFRPASTYGITCEWEVPDDVIHGADAERHSDGRNGTRRVPTRVQHCRSKHLIRPV